MIRTVQIFLFLFFSVLIELLLSRNGMALPLAGLIVFYVSYVFGIGWGIGAAAFGGMLRDFSFGMPHPWSMLFLLGVALFALFWLYQMESNSLLLLMIPGAMLPVLFPLPVWLIEGGFGWRNLLETFSDTIACAILFSVLFPCLIILLDALNVRLNLGVYADAKERLLKKGI